MPKPSLSNNETLALKKQQEAAANRARQRNTEMQHKAVPSLAKFYPSDVKDLNA